MLDFKEYKFIIIVMCAILPTISLFAYNTTASNKMTLNTIGATAPDDVNTIDVEKQINVQHQHQRPYRQRRNVSYVNKTSTSVVAIPSFTFYNSATSVQSYGGGSQVTGEMNNIANYSTSDSRNTNYSMSYQVLDIATYKSNNVRLSVKKSTDDFLDGDLAIDADMQDGKIVRRAPGGNGPITQPDDKKPEVTPLDNDLHILFLTIIAYIIITQVRRRKEIG